MSRLLYIQASPRIERSHSIAVANKFIEAYKKIHPKDEIQTLNLYNAKLPEFDALAAQAKYAIMHGKTHSKKELAAWNKVEKVIKQFTDAGKYVLAVPMWNFGIPYKLKQYIDLIVQPAYTFSFSEKNGYEGLVKGKPVVVIYARGGDYSAGYLQAYDIQKTYIDLILGFMGFENIQSVIIEPTLQGGPDVAEAKQNNAIEKARHIAADF